MADFDMQFRCSHLLDINQSNRTIYSEIHASVQGLHVREQTNWYESEN